MAGLIDSSLRGIWVFLCLSLDFKTRLRWKLLTLIVVEVKALVEACFFDREEKALKALVEALTVLYIKMDPEMIDLAALEEVAVDGQSHVGSDAAASPGQSQSGNVAANTDPVADHVPNMEANPKKRKENQQSSVVWEHFDAIKDGKGTIMQAKCCYCARVYNCHAKKNGTSILRSHLIRCTKHPHSVETRQALLSFQPINVEARPADNLFSVATWKFDQEVVRKAIAYMIIVDELPFKFVEKQGFRRVMSLACPMFKMPSRWTVNRDCYAMFVDEKLKLKQFFKTHSQRVSLTSDSWTSNQRLNYMCITAHFIDNDWKLHKRIIYFVTCSRHKGEYLSKSMETCLQEWGLKNIFSVTLDNAENNTTAMGFFIKKMLTWGSTHVRCKYAHMRCIAHILNLVVSDGLKESGSSFQKVRGAVRYIKNSPLGLSKFKECKKSLDFECKRSLCLDVPTRWNSTYLMLDTACLYQPVFEEYEDVEASFRIDLGDEVPDKHDWDKVRQLCVLLQCFYKMTLRISGSLYVTSNNHLNEISDLSTILQDWTKSSDYCLRSMATKMKFDKYWGDPNVMNKLIFFANILDPRDRIVYLGYTLNQLYGCHAGKFLYTCVMEDLAELFNDYEVIYKKEVATTATGGSGQLAEPVAQSSQVNSVLKERFLQQMLETGGVSGSKKNELEIYLSEAVVANDASFDILRWWKLNSERFSVLSRMARDILAVPVSTVASESAFSTGGRVLDDFRSCLTPKIVEALVCTQDWLRDPSKPVSIEESLEEMEQHEEGLQDPSTALNEQYPLVVGAFVGSVDWHDIRGSVLISLFYEGCDDASTVNDFKYFRKSEILQTDFDGGIFGGRIFCKIKKNPPKVICMPRVKGDEAMTTNQNLITVVSPVDNTSYIDVRSAKASITSGLMPINSNFQVS
ncbi:zinc finger BED domain-containing protein RICESLEEPER 2-like [Mercurialis annua]|uniref:zinc finger BED domain-containing protein RICESLEEPER 2-like n=1 Tax=Mercurialis annua TaxID=3986 RepID=UPI00215EC194|nr:zinc finger BED domain-containing protein RICESLEEPER 2-like [Mercurialis annua]